jgi:hypothetical protein
MIDNDVVPLGNPLEMVEADKDVVGFPAKVRQTDRCLNWVAYMHHPDEDVDMYAPIDFTLVDSTTDLLKVDVVGTGCILIKRKVLEELQAPFHTEFHDNGVLAVGTDFAFCRKAQKAGYEIFTAPQRVCEHFKEVGMLDLSYYNTPDDTDKAAGKYGIPWGWYSIMPGDWNFILRIINELRPNNVLEFGAGLSSLLMAEHVKVVSYETDEKQAEVILAKANGNLDVRLWNGKELEAPGQYDLAFIDGPRDGRNREEAFKIAAQASDHVICHDAQRTPETEWQKRYLRGKFHLARRSGYHSNCCHYWKRIQDGEGDN